MRQVPNIMSLYKNAQGRHFLVSHVEGQKIVALTACSIHYDFPLAVFQSLELVQASFTLSTSDIRLKLVHLDPPKKSYAEFADVRVPPPVHRSTQLGGVHQYRDEQRQAKVPSTERRARKPKKANWMTDDYEQALLKMKGRLK